MEWEYEVRPLGTTGDIESIRSDVQQAASEGWELISVVRDEEAGWLLAFFKREKRHEPGEFFIGHG